MNKALHALYSLQFNPFGPQIPPAALWSWPALEQFCWRLEQQVTEGGFALVIGDPGTGKSAALRLLANHLGQLRDLKLGILTRPQASLADFYRELGHLFGLALRPHNRWASSKTLRDQWLQHHDTSLLRPVLLVDEAQEMSLAVFSELRLLASADLDSRSILTVVLSGDGRLGARLESPELLPLASRIRSRLRTQALPPEQLTACLEHLLQAAGNPDLLPPTLRRTLSEHAAGNLRLLLNLANELLQAALRQGRDTLDEKLFFEVFAASPKPRSKRP